MPAKSNQHTLLFQLHRNLRVILIVFLLMAAQPLFAQTKTQYIRVAKIVVDSAQLQQYNAALKEGITTAVQLEPGVITLYAVSDINNPTHITVFEIYADKEAYALHIQTPHFKKYKATTQSMVKTRELTDVLPIALAAKPK